MYHGVTGMEVLSELLIEQREKLNFHFVGMINIFLPDDDYWAGAIFHILLAYDRKSGESKV